MDLVSSQTYKPTALDIAREVFPDREEDELEYLIWNRTGFPAFWPTRFKNAVGALRWQLKAYRRAEAGLREGERLCDFCNRKAMPGGKPLCQRCSWMLDESNGD